MVSFVIPCYKSNIRYLKKAIDSVLNQTSEQWELILADGNLEPDSSIKNLVSELNHTRIQYIHNNIDNSMAGNWNFGFSKANSELVVLLHDDDYLMPSYIENILLLANEYPNSAAYFCDVNVVNTEGETIFSFPDKIKGLLSPQKSIVELKGDNGLAMLLKGCFIFCPTVCYRKLKCDSEPFSSKWRMVTDFQMYLDILIKGHSIVGTSAKLYNYRRHTANQTSKLTNNFSRFDEEVAFYNYIALSLDSDWVESKRLAHNKSIIKLHLAYRVLVNFLNFKLMMSFSCLRYLVKLI